MYVLLKHHKSPDNNYKKLKKEANIVYNFIDI